MAGGGLRNDTLPGSVHDLDADARPLRDALEADFARLGHQLRRDVARELRSALREIFTEPQHTLASSGLLRDLITPRPTHAPEHHEWTRRHPRGFLAQELIHFFPDQAATPSHPAVSKSPRGPSTGAVNQARRDSSAGHVLISREETPNTLSGNPEADTLNLTIKSGASSQAALIRDHLRQAADESTTTEVVNVAMDDEAEEQPAKRSPGGQESAEVSRPNAWHSSEESRPKGPLPLGGQLVAHTPKATNLSPHRALGLVPSNTHFLTLESQDPTSFHHKLSVLVCSVWFERLALFMNVASAALVGYQTDHMARHIEEHHDLFLFRATDVVFLIFFTVEAALRLYVHKCRFFKMSGWGWNVFDLLLVTFQFSEEVVRIASVRGNDLWSSFLLRVVRVFRTIKLFRVMGHFDEFRLLVACILHSCKSFFWAVALLFLMNYVMATYLVQIICASMLSGDLAREYWGTLTAWYGSLGSAVYSIFVGLSGGVDWNDIVDPIKVHISPYAASLFMIFMLFAILALMNVVTGTFVQNAIERADEVKQINKVQQARRLFKSLDVDSSGFIGFSELRNHLDSPEVQGYFRTIDVDLSEARCLFDMLDMNDSGSIDFQEFLSGCIRLQGHARSLDLLMVARDMRCSFDVIMKHFMTLEDNQRAIRSLLATLTPNGGGEASEAREAQGKMDETV